MGGTLARVRTCRIAPAFAGGSRSSWPLSSRSRLQRAPNPPRPRPPPRSPSPPTSCNASSIRCNNPAAAPDPRHPAPGLDRGRARRARQSARAAELLRPGVGPDRHHHRRDPGGGAGRGRCAAARPLDQGADRERGCARDFWIGVAGAARHHLRRGLRRRAHRLSPAAPRRATRRCHARDIGRIAALPDCCSASSSRRPPVAVFAAAASLAVPFTQAAFGTRQVAHVLIAAILWARIMLARRRAAALLSGAAAALYSLGDEIAPISLYLGAALHELGGLWLRARRRRLVAGRARRDLCAHPARHACWCSPSSRSSSCCRTAAASATGCTAAASGDGGGWRMIRHRLADTWHVLAVIYIVGTFGVYVLDVSKAAICSCCARRWRASWCCWARRSSCAPSGA